MDIVQRVAVSADRKIRVGRGLVLCLCLTILAACGTAPKEGGYYQDDGPGGRSASEFENIPDLVPRDEPVVAASLRPYRVFDRQYEPLSERQPFTQSGVASWYGKQFQGKPTAIGEPYDMYKLTAAHPTLPLPSYVRVRNLDNQRSVIVRVNDRGPFSNGRIIDLSFAAAARLGYVEKGTTLVSIEVVDPIVTAMEKGHVAPPPPPVRLSERRARAPEAASTIPASQASLPVPAFTLAEPRKVRRTVGNETQLSGSRQNTGQRQLSQQQLPPVDPVEISPLAGGATSGTVGVRVETLRDSGLRPAIPEPDQDRRPVSSRDPLAPRDWSRLTEDAPAVRAERKQIAAISAEARRVELNERSAASEEPLIFLQFGAYTTEKAAREDLYRHSSSFNGLFLPVQIVVERGLYKIQAGPFESEGQAETAIKRFRAESGLQPFYVYR